MTRRLLMGVCEHKTGVVILDVTGVPNVDSGVAAYLDKTIQVARPVEPGIALYTHC